MSLAFLGKKSFNPTNIKNQEKVWLAEKAHDEEQKRLEEFQKQITEEREIRELQELQGGTREDRIDWMYEGPMSGGAVHAEDEAKKAEEYLLGKAFELPKQKNEEITLAVTGGSGTIAGGDSANARVGAAIKQPTANELFRRMHEDPLLRMRQAETSSKASILANPIKMRKIHMEADAVAKAQKQAKKLKKAAKKAKRRERKEENKQSLGSKKRQRYDSDTSYDNEDNCGGNMRRESNRPKYRHKHHESTARKSSEGTHHLERSNDSSSNVKTEEGVDYRRDHGRDRECHERRKRSGHHHYHQDRERTTTSGRHLTHDKDKERDNGGRIHKIDKKYGERDHKGRHELYDRTREKKEEEKVVALHKDGRDAHYGLMNGTKKESYKAKDLGPDEDSLRKSMEKAKAEEAEKAASRVRKNAHMGHKEKVALAKEMESDGRRHEMYTAEKSKEYEWRKKIENDEIKTGSQGGDSRREKDETDRNFLKQIEQTAISSSTLHGRIAARKHYQQRDQDAESFMQQH
eukprot:404382_1